jgi:prephenate dehydrogenase
MGIERLSILGVGLLGGSLGLAMKRLANPCQIAGYGHRPETLKRAKELGAIDIGYTSAVEAVAGADLVVLATPVGLFEPLLKEIGPALKEGAVVTDVGSTKRSVVRLAESILPSSVSFVGSHPMAGSEKRGVEHASADLFQNALCILTPSRQTSERAATQVGEFWTSLGMRLTICSPEDHDRWLAEVSHLPHAVAAALVSLPQDAALGMAGKGFMDATRIAGGDGGLWRDILLDNRDHMLASIDTLVGRLGQLSELLKSNRGDELAAWLDQAARRRNALSGRKHP